MKKIQLINAYIGFVLGVILMCYVTKGFTENIKMLLLFSLIAIPRLIYQHSKYYKLTHKLF